jgi:hypothetical protein
MGCHPGSSGTFCLVRYLVVAVQIRLLYHPILYLGSSSPLHHRRNRDLNGKSKFPGLGTLTHRNSTQLAGPLDNLVRFRAFINLYSPRHLA